MANLLKWGLCPAASAALIGMGVAADRIVQTVGHASASGGVHLLDGKIGGEPYCAATDFSIHHPSPYGDVEIKQFLTHLAQHGFAAYYRDPGHFDWPACDPAHIHAVYAGVGMKPALQTQVHDWLHGLDGLRDHGRYGYWQPTPAECSIVRTLFLAHNPA